MRGAIKKRTGILLLAAGGNLLALSNPYAATPLQTVRHSADVHVVLAGVTLADEQVAEDDLVGGVGALSFGGVPARADVDAYHDLGDGEVLLSFDTAVALPFGVVAERADVVRFDGAGYTLELDASAAGVPDRADVDAVSRFDGLLLLSFDVTVELDGVTVDDADLVLFDGVSFTLFFDGAAAGIERPRDLDAAHHVACNDHLLVSFDGSGNVGGVTFDDEDVLEYDPAGGTWELAYDGSERHAMWPVADLDALHVTVDPGPGPPSVFGQTVVAESTKTDFVWPLPTDWVAVRGSFISASDVGAYAFEVQAAGAGTGVVDVDLPDPGSGFWYLFRLGGCAATSWQTTLGAEPGRDAALP